MIVSLGYYQDGMAWATYLEVRLPNIGESSILDTTLLNSIRDHGGRPPQLLPTLDEKWCPLRQGAIRRHGPIVTLHPRRGLEALDVAPRLRAPVRLPEECWPVLYHAS